MTMRALYSGGSRLFIASVLVCSTALVCVKGVHAAKPAKLAKESRRAGTREIEQFEAQWRAAVVNGDAAFLEKLLSDDFFAISARGTLSDKRQYLERIATHATQFSTFDLMDLKVRIHQGSAVAISQARIAGLLEGKPIAGTFRYTKVYNRTAGGPWRMTNFEATKVSADGNGDMDTASPMPQPHSR